MIHYQTYTSTECAKIVELWNSSFGSEFPMDERLWKQNVDHCSKTFADASIVAVLDGHIVGVVIGKNPNKISALFVAPEFRRRGIATELLERAEVAFTGELETTLVTGQDDRHFFPGVPEAVASAQEFFAARGYTGSDGYNNDMFRSLSDWQPLSTKDEVREALKSRNITLTSCNQELIPSLLDHVSSNFSDRWLRDTRDRIALEPDASEIMVAVQNADTVVGFAHTWSNRSSVVGSPILWRKLIGDQYGGLGPIGVDRDYRKIGLGLELLNYSISQVAATGAENMVIDWTGLVDFYAKAGFKVWKRYRHFSKTY